MATVRFTRHLARYFPGLEKIEVEAKNVASLVMELDRRFPGIKDYLVDESGALRKHVNIFVGDELVIDRSSLNDQLDNDSDVYIMQALSGG